MTNNNENKKTTKRADKMLTKLADFLENDIKDNVFDLGVFWYDEDDDDGGSLVGDGGYNCGTTACACGWAAVSPKFRGLTATGAASIYHEKSDTYEFTAAGNYFNITTEQALYLFDPNYYSYHRRGRKSVVNRIRKFIEDGGVKGSGKYTKYWLGNYGS